MPAHMMRSNYNIINREEAAHRQDLTRTLTVKKRLRDHLLIKGFYDQKPNYAELAR